MAYNNYQMEQQYPLNVPLEQTLTVEGVDLTNKLIKGIEPNYTKLVVRHARSRNWVAICQQIAKKPAITSLTIQHCRLTDYEAEAIANVLTHQLIEVNLGSCGFRQITTI